VADTSYMFLNLSVPYFFCSLLVKNVLCDSDYLFEQETVSG